MFWLLSFHALTLVLRLLFVGCVDDVGDDVGDDGDDDYGGAVGCLTLQWLESRELVLLVSLVVDGFGRS